MGLHDEFKTPEQVAKEKREALRTAYPKSAAATDFMQSLFGPVKVLRFEEDGKTHQIKNYKPDSECGQLTPTQFIEMGKKGAAVEVQTSAQRGGQRGKN